MKPALQIAVGAGPMHVVIGGRAACGKAVDDRDLLPDGSGLHRWNGGELKRCRACETALSSRAGHTSAAVSI